MRIVKFLLILVMLFNLISCATIINGSSERIEIFSNADNTDIYVNDVLMGHAGIESPLEVTIPKRGRVALVGKKKDCDDGEEVVRRTIDPATFLGLLIDFGLVSILLVDILGTNAFVHANQRTYVLDVVCR